MGPMMKTWMSKVHWFYLMKRSEVKDSSGTKNSTRHKIYDAKQSSTQLKSSDGWSTTEHPFVKPETQCSVFTRHSCSAARHGYFLLGTFPGLSLMDIFSMDLPLSFVHWSFCQWDCLSQEKFFFIEAFFPKTFLESCTLEISAFSTWGPPHLRDPSVVSRLSCSCGSAPRCAHVFHRLHVPCIRDDTKSIFLCNIMSFFGESLTEEVHSPSWDVSMNSLLFVLYVCSTNVNNLK